MSNLDKKYYHNIDLDSNELKAGRIYNLTTTQRLALSLSTSDKGYVVYDITLLLLYIWDGSSWNYFSNSSGTVTSISAGTGMSFSTITTTGSISIDTTKIPYFSGGISGTPDNTTYLRGDGQWTTVQLPLSGTGIVKSTSGTISYIIDNSADWDTAYADRNKWDGGSTGLNASTGRTSLGATTVGGNIFTLTNPSAIRFIQINADNSVSTLDASSFRTAIGAGTSSTTGTVTSVAALTLGTSGTDLSSTVVNGTTTPIITLNVPTASATNRGVLSSTDWSTFNNKQASGNYITALTGDVTASGPGSASATIANAAVTLAKMANLTANTIIGNNTGSAATPLALTGTQVTAMLDTFSTSTTTKGLVPGSNSLGTTYFLRADGTWAVPSGGGGGTPAGSNTQVQYNNSSAFGGANMYWDNANNRLGINTASPTYDLEITSGSNGIYVKGSAASCIVLQRSADTTGSANAYFYKSRGTYGSPTACQDADGIGVFNFAGYDGSAYTQTAYFGGIVEGTPSAGTIGIGIRFVTGTTVANRTERMRISSTGLIGIGTTSPTHKIEAVVGTLTDGVSAFYLSATMPTTIAGPMNAIDYQITSAGSSSQTNTALNVSYLAGYTGTSSTNAANITNAIVTGSTDVTTFGVKNTGAFIGSSGNHSGTNCGVLGSATNALQNFGVFGRAVTAKNSATNIGVFGAALNTGISPIQIGGLFYLGNSTVATLTSAALIADNGSQTSPIFIARDNGTAIFTIGDVATTHVVSLTAGTLTDGFSAFNLTATMPTSISGSSNGILFDITSAGSSSQTNSALRVNYNAGYTGANPTRAMIFTNSAAGTASIATGSLSSNNVGAGGACNGTTTGSNVGVYGNASNADISIGGLFFCSTAKNSGKNIGVLGLAVNTGTSSIQVGGYFGLHATNPTLTSAALIADNETTTSDVFLLRDNGTVFLKAADGGFVGIGNGSTAATSQFQVNKNQNSVSTSDADGILLANSTAAINGTQSISPPIVQQGYGYGTTAGTSQDVRFRYNVLPVQGTTASGTWQLAASLNGGAYSNVVTVTSAGVMAVNTVNASTLTASTQFYVGSSTSAGNLVVGSGNGTMGISTSSWVYGSPTSGFVQVRTGIVGATNITLGAGDNYASFVVGGQGTITEAASGTHNFIANVVIKALSLTNGAGATANTASLYIAGAPSGITPTGGNYAIYVASGNNYFNGAVYSEGVLSSSLTTTTANFTVAGSNRISSSDSSAWYQIGSSSNVQYRTGFYGSASDTLTAGTSYSSVIFGKAPVTMAGSGTHGIVANVSINALTITTGAATITRTASLYIDGAATGAFSAKEDYTLYIASGDNYFGGYTIQANNLRTTSDFNKTNTTLSDVTGLSGTLKAACVYKFKALLHARPDSTGGFKVAIGGTCTATSIIYQTIVVDNATKSIINADPYTALVGTSTGSGTNTALITIEGTIVVNAAGTLTVQFAQNSASGTSSIISGSTFEIERIL